MVIFWSRVAGTTYACPPHTKARAALPRLGWTDPRKEPGELLWGQRFGSMELDDLKRSLGSYAAAGLLQQRPSPAEGGMLKRHRWRFWRPQGAKLPPVVVRFPDGSLQALQGAELPAVLHEQIRSWDGAFKDLETSDFVVGQVGGRLGADCAPGPFGDS